MNFLPHNLNLSKTSLKIIMKNSHTTYKLPTNSRNIEQEENRQSSSPWIQPPQFFPIVRSKLTSQGRWKVSVLDIVKVVVENDSNDLSRWL